MRHAAFQSRLLDLRAYRGQPQRSLKSGGGDSPQEWRRLRQQTVTYRHHRRRLRRRRCRCVATPVVATVREVAILCRPPEV